MLIRLIGSPSLSISQHPLPLRSAPRRESHCSSARKTITPKKAETVEVLKAFLDVDNSKAAPSYEEAVATLQVSVGAVKTLIHRLRKQYARLVREEIERTVSDPGDVDAEIHELCEALVVAEGWIVP